MKLELEFVQLHAGDPLFFEGVNYGEKLYTDSRKTKGKKLELTYDTEERLVYVKSGTKTTIVPSFASATLWDGVVKKEVEWVTHPVVAGVSVKAQVGGPNEVKQTRTAQVSTPMDAVQGKPGRKAKYQGGENQGE